MSDKTPNNPPAFPSSRELGPEGMSLRDYFAAKAMAGMLAADAGFGSGPRRSPLDPLEQPGGGKWIEPDGVARQSYAIADAMLVAREKTGGGA